MGSVLGVQISCDAFFSDCLNCTLRKAAYVTQLEDNVAALQTELQKLIEARNDVITRVVYAERQQMIRLNKVQGWLSRVEAVETEVGKLTRDSSQEIERLCIGGYCSKNCKSSYNFGKKVATNLQLVVTLMGEGVFEVVAEKVPEPAVDEKPCDPTIVGLDLTFNDVWRCLGEEQVGIIGLYGMGGVGKTTLLTQINNKCLDSGNNFDIVIWVVVSRDVELKRIQEKIGERIGLPANRSMEENASNIFRFLNKKKFLLLLDDIWERIDLAKVGVPFPSPTNASKVVFTTRIVNVCGLMEAHKTYKVKCLEDEEARKLFLKKVGEETLKIHPDIPMLAQTMVKECGGLPLALITTARAMVFKKTPQEWSHAIEMLRMSASKFPGMGKEVYPLLKFSYDSLPGDMLRFCLLYCSLFPEDYKIDKNELIDCWIGEGILNKYEGIRDQGYYIIGILVHACLLEEVGSDHVKMHDVIRDMALWIACEIEKEKENFMVFAGVQLTEAPEVRKWEGMRRVSLMRNKIENLPDTPRCPHLQTLFLGINRLKIIGSGFFEYMPSLTVLNLSKNRYLKKLPLGVSRLVSLRYLNLSDTPITKLPIELKALVNLECLNLEYTYNLSTIPRRMICNFSMLHVLRMHNCGSNIEIPEETVLFGNSEFLVEELLSLKHLIVLSITLKSFSAVRKLLNSQKFQSCTKSLELRDCDDSESFALADLKNLEKLGFSNCRNVEELKVHYLKVEKTRECFRFNSLHRVNMKACHKLREVTWLVFAPNLQIIRIERCKEMEEIISATKLGEVTEMMADLNPFAKLQDLRLRVLPKLKSIYWNVLPSPFLMEIFVAKCPNLKNLPLGFNNVKEPKIVIRGEEHWWNELQWEDQATLNAFLPCFGSI